MSAIALYTHAVSKQFIVTSPEAIIAEIASDSYREYIDYLRKLNKSEYDAEKKNLPGIIWSGVCQEGTRLDQTIVSYSSLIVLDIDKLEPTALELLKSQLAKDEHVRYCFISPSGTGLKIVIEVNTKLEHHVSAFLHLQKHYEDKYLVKIDSSGKNVSRLCFISHDPTLIINQNSKVFVVDMKYGEVFTAYKNDYSGYKDETDAKKIFAICVKWVERNKVYRDGEKNVFIHALACALNRVGVNCEQAIQLITDNFTTPDILWHQSVKGAYFRGQNEHNTFPIKDVGATEFIAPPYVMTFSEDIVADDIMKITSSLYHHKVPSDFIYSIIHKIGDYYHNKEYIDLRRTSLQDLMNRAITLLKENTIITTEKSAIPYQSAEDMILDLLGSAKNDNAISTGFPDFDDAMFGGFMASNFYGIIGMGESYKSIFAQRICFINAVNGIPSIYINGEMSKFQFYERLCSMALGIDLRAEMKLGTVTTETVGDLIAQMKEVTKNNIHVINQSGITKQGILSTIDLISAKENKEIKLLITDGLTQMDWAGMTEINATIHNSMVGKEVAKEANGGKGIAHIALIHISGDIKKWTRNTDDYVRGAKKVLANLDAYFCNSRLIDPITNDLVNEDDVRFLKDKFYLRYVDKRSRSGIVNRIINVGENISLKVENIAPEEYEFKIKKKQL